MTHVLVQEEVTRLAGSRPYQNAQAALSRWVQRYSPRWAQGKSWKGLTSDEKIQAARGMMKSKWYKGLKNADKKKSLADYCHMITSTGVVPERGRKLTKASSSTPGRAVAPAEATITAVTLMGTFYPLHNDWNQKYGPGQYADVSWAAKGIKGDPEYAGIKQAFSDWVAELMKTVPDLRWLVTLELCPATWNSGVVRLHGHFQFARKGYKVLTLPAATRYQNKHIHMERGTVDRRQAQAVTLRAFYYVYAPKVGSLEAWGNYCPHKDFGVNPMWITGLVATSKLSFQSAVKEHLDAVDRAQFYVQNLLWVEAKRREIENEEKRLMVEAEIQRDLEPISMPGSWKKFQKQSEDPNLHRFSFYVATGPPRSRKTQSVRAQYPIGALLELNCSGGCLTPDFTQLRPEHQAILFDEASPQMIAKYKVEFQAGNNPCTLGTSQCQQYAYKQRLYRIQMIICSNKWHEELSWLYDLDDRKWIEENSIVQDVTLSTFKLFID